ncbi:MAG: bifunctional riboflavin kinase/FAD synthetase [Anaerolineales bacterium]|jgi:riboflavin kinase/FMN adenylyltransferase
MQQYSGLQDVSLQDAWLTIGSFDGVHLGHQQIIKQITSGAHASGVPAVVLTFHPHPSVVLRGPRESFYLTTQEKKAALLEALGVDILITQPFNREVSSISAGDFVNQLYTHLNIQQLWVGHDFAMGHNREGTFSVLEAYGEELGFKVQALDAFQIEGEVVSSSRIRRCLEAGQVEQAAKLLGRPFSLCGLVEKGDGRGHKIGSPTANLAIRKELAVPAAGVYAVRVNLDNQTYRAVSNIGVRPTFEEQTTGPRVEAHILNFDKDIYGEEIELEFAAHLRDEQRFPSVEALIAQIQADIRQAEAIFTKQEVGS